MSHSRAFWFISYETDKRRPDSFIFENALTPIARNDAAPNGRREHFYKGAVMIMFGKRAAAGMLAALLVAGALAASAAEAGPISAERAREIALAQTGGGDVVNMGRHYRGKGISYYRFEIVGSNGAFHVEVDESNGNLLKFINKHGYRGYQGYPATAPSMSAPSVPSAPAPSTPAPTMPVGNAITQDQALAIALGQTGGGTVVETEVDVKNHGRIVYEFEIINNGSKFEVEVDGSSGTILKFKQKGGRHYYPANTPGAAAPTPVPGGGMSPRLSMEAAQALAKEKTGGGTVTKYQLDRDDGRLVHEMKLVNAGTRYEIEIDDATGAFLEFSID